MVGSLLQGYRLALAAGVAACLLALLVIAVPAAWAINYNTGTYGSCQYDSCSISITTSSSVAINVTPTTSGSCSTQKDVVSVLTDDSSGYSLTLANSSTNTGLLNGAASIAATSGTRSSPTALAANKWGYRVDGIGGFGAGQTSAQTNVALNSTTYAGVPASSGTADTLASTSSTANPAVSTNVWYSVCTNTSAASGSYTTQITYTATAN